MCHKTYVYAGDQHTQLCQKPLIHFWPMFPFYILEINEKENLSRCVASFSLISFLKTERRLIYRTIVPCLRSFCSIFVQRNYRKHLLTVQQTGKQGYFNFRLNNFANMYENSSCLCII